MENIKDNKTLFEILVEGIDVYKFVTLEEVLEDFDLEEDRVAFLEYYYKNKKDNFGDSY